jgi:hypothetical protein
VQHVPCAAASCGPGIGTAPNGVPARQRSQYPQACPPEIDINAVRSHAMPPGNISAMTTAERQTARGLDRLAIEVRLMPGPVDYHARSCWLRPHAAPDPRWPGRARVAGQFVVNFEEGGENPSCMATLPPEAFLTDVLGATPWPGQRI